MADEDNHTNKNKFKVPFVRGIVERRLHQCDPYSIQTVLYSEFV